jgi:arylsulfatase A-like enzyme
MLALGCGESPAAAPALASGPPRGIILISFDTLRADHLGAYGYRRETSPFFDQLAARGTLFDEAWVQFPSTLTSHMSMLTGLYPAQHGVYPPRGRLAADVVTLAERLQRHGLRTAAHTEGGYVRGGFGFRRGFDEMRARDARGPREIERTFGRGLAFLSQLGPDDRFFLFLHTYCVHAPYAPPAGYRGTFWSAPPPAGAFEPTGPLLARQNQSGEKLSADVVAYFTALYDESIRYADAQLAALVGSLERMGLADEVILVVTADHGEELQEHGLMNHDQLYPEVMHVPLLVVTPERRPARHRRVVQSIDLAPSLLALAGAPAAPELPGRSFAADLGHDVPMAPSEAFAEAPEGRRSLVHHDGERLWQLLVGGSPPRAELYDLSADRSARVNLSDRERRQTRRLLDRLEAYRWAPREAPQQVLDAETEAELKSLGYLQ